jgi:amino acid adenylation domain-containing protein
MMRTALEKLTEALEKAPETPVRSIDALPEAERRQVVEQWNATEADYPKEKLIHELFEEQAERSPHALALVYEEQSLTYSELNARANRLAHHLITLGVGPESLVAICLERSAEMVVALLATLKAGGAYVPLDPDYPAERLAYTLEDSAPAVLLTLGAINSALAASLPAIPTLDLNNDETRWITQSDQNIERSAAGWNAQSLAYVIYTSGSTGQPKGAMNEHRGVLNRLIWMQEAYGLGPGDAVLQKTPFSFDVSVWEFFWPLLNGARLVMASPGGHKDPAYLARTIRRQEITTLHFVPSMLQVFLENPEASDCGEVRRVICSGESLPAPLARRFYELLPESELHNLYGPTEAAVDVTAWNCKDNTTSKGIPIGRPVANTSMYVLDAEWKPAPVGVGGELYIGGAQVGRGYHHRPEMTAERFLPDLFSRHPGARSYKTGDVGRWAPEGTIEFLGRNDSQVKIRGFRIELGEIEARLTSHPNIHEAVVAQHEDGEGDRRLVAYYTGEKVGVESLRAHLLSVLPGYMAPSDYVHLERLPLTPNGKLDRRALPSPDVRRLKERNVALPPQTPLEQIVAGIFEEALNLEVVGRSENFFDLGGHSLLATKVISRIRKMLGVEIGVKSVFDAPTAEGLSRKIEAAMRAGEKIETPPLVRVERERGGIRKAPLSFAQQRLWFTEQMNPGSAAYNIPGAARLEGDLNVDALQRVINEIVRRHEVLRTRFEVEAGEPIQVIDEWAPRSLEIVDLTSLPPESLEEEVSRRAIEEAETGFNLNQGPLLRVKVLKLGEEDHVLLYTMHHIVSDGWSAGIMISEVEALYKSFSVGEDSPLKELPIQYADFAVWQRSWLQGEALESQIAYWRRQLAGQPPALELPTDHLRQAKQTNRGAQCWRLMPTDLSNSLQALSLKRHCTLFMTLMAAFKTLLYYLTKQTDICVGTDIANRNHAETEKLIGFFINQLALRTRLSPDLYFEDLLKKVREVTLEAFAHQDLPFEKVVEALNPDRDENRTPLFQVKMTLQNASDEELSLPGLTLSSLGTVISAAKFDLLLDLTDTEEGLIASLQYSADLFEESATARILNRFHTLLERIVERPDARLQELIESLIAEDEREHIEQNSELESVRLSKLKSARRRAVREIQAAAEQ